MINSLTESQKSCFPDFQLDATCTKEYTRLVGNLVSFTRHTACWNAANLLGQAGAHMPPWKYDSPDLKWIKEKRTANTLKITYKPFVRTKIFLMVNKRDETTSRRRLETKTSRISIPMQISQSRAQALWCPYVHCLTVSCNQPIGS